MRFKPGQEVVCVDDKPFHDRSFNIRHGALVRGAVYTIRDYVPQQDWIPPLCTDEPCVRLNEITRWKDKIGFRESRFEPIKKPKPKAKVAVKKRIKESV